MDRERTEKDALDYANRALDALNEQLTAGGLSHPGKSALQLLALTLADVERGDGAWNEISRGELDSVRDYLRKGNPTNRLENIALLHCDRAVKVLDREAVRAVEAREAAACRRETGQIGTDQFEREAWERIRQARERREAEKERGKDRDGGRKRDE